jgi:molybdate transport system regulatory protein
MKKIRVPDLSGSVSIDSSLGSFLGDTRIRLLEAIALHGSISRAAKEVPLSYKAAWEAVEAINNLAPQPVVERSAGGRDGGGTLLTAYGLRLIAFYRALEAEHRVALERLGAAMHGGSASSVEEFRQLVKKMSMKISARNQFGGPITALREGAVNFEVRMRIDDVNELVANITKESAETLGLAIGKEVLALVKASSVMLMTDKKARTSARNHLWGEVSAIHKGAVNSEVGIKLPSGRAMTAIVTDDSVAHLGLAVGKPACAVFKASSVILAVLD